MYGMVFCVANQKLTPSFDLPECDLCLVGFEGLGEVDYERELRGESEKFEQLCRLSKKCGCGIVCGCTTVSRGLLRKSVAVADKGKLLGISDMNHVLDGEQYKSGAGLGFYKVNGCNVGLCIENDLMFPDTFKALSLCGCTVVVALMEELINGIPPLLARAYSYLYGMPVVMSAGKVACFADVSGALATSTRDLTLFEVSSQNRYHVVTTRTRGISAETKADF